MWVKLGSWLVVVLLISTLVGCGGSSTSTPPPPAKATLTSITVTPSGSTIAFGSTQQFKATGKYSDGTSKDISSTVAWSSSSSSIASISSAGLATPVKGGQVTITATSGAISGSTTLTVGVALSSITVSSSASGINVGQTAQFTATGNYADGSTKDLTSSVIWTSSAPAVASISGSGLASGLKGGQASIMATSGSVNNSSLLTVTALLSSISIIPSSPGVFVGSTLQFGATGNYNDGTTRNLTSSVAWSSSDTAKATISLGGLASGVKGGQVNITAALGSVSNAASLNVTALLKSFSLTPIGPGILVGSSQQFSAIGNFNDATTQDLTAKASWTSSDVAKATIANGHATGASAGPVTITVSGTSADGSSVSANTALNVVSSAYASLNGNYAFTMLAADSRGPQMFAGSFHANPPDGSGHGTIDSGVEDANTSAGVVQREPVSGSYIWYPDGRGTITFNSNRIHPNGIALRFVLAANGTTAGALGRLAQFDGKGTAKGTFELQNPSSFNNAAMSGAYVFRASGIDSSSQPMGQLGVFSSDGAGNITSGSVDTNDFGAITALSALTPANYSVGANGRGTLQLVSSSGTANFSVYVVNSTKVNLIQIDSGHTAAVAGVAELQDAQTYNAACLHGGYAFLIDRPVVVGTNGNFDRREFAQVGEYTFDGVSAITGVRDDTNNGTSNPLTGITGGYSVAVTGGRGTLNAITTQGTRSYVFYFVSYDKLFVLQTYNSPTLGSFNAPTGTAIWQSGMPYSKASLTGSYALAVSDLTASYTEALMQLVFDGSGGVDGIADVSSNGEVSSSVVNADYSSFSPNPDPTDGRGAIHLPSPLGANDYVFYLTSPQNAWLLGITPDMDGVMDQQ
jgi:hypothetical protein